MVLRSLFLAIVFVAGGAATAAAQSVTEVPAGSAFDVRNGTECMPNTEVELLFEQAGVAVPIGSTIADAAGHFEYAATLPGSASQGVAQVTATCGLEDQVLVFDVVVVAATSGDILGFSRLALASMAGLVVLIAALVWRVRGDATDARSERGAGSDANDESIHDLSANVTVDGAREAVLEDGNRSGASDEGISGVEATAVGVGVDVAADGDEGEAEPDYWFWDAETQRGQVKRIACLSERGFYLHEAAQDDFGPLLESLAVDGPDQVFASSFLAVDLASIDEVQRRGSQLRIVYRDGSERLARVVDLGAEVDGVLDLLGRRAEVVPLDQLAGR